MGAIHQGGLFSVNVDIVPTKIGECAHVVLPAATSGEVNLTSMNGERRMRLTATLKRFGLNRNSVPRGASTPFEVVIETMTTTASCP